ncbi:hypothetical protein AGMMS50222_01610 [Endomicrobiia bacterium]|nr:hypothetical protein AGMMS49556_01470 [Endomicrobiia bacterium]GHT73696.1 hypothetical protein AGMMS50222_01610 [Endomicrobiia bacterium]
MEEALASVVDLVLALVVDLVLALAVQAQASHSAPHNQHKHTPLDLIHNPHCRVLQLLKFPYLSPHE